MSGPRLFVSISKMDGGEVLKEVIDHTKLPANCFDYLDQGISIMDADLTLVFCNDKFAELLELPRDLMVFQETTLEDIFRYNAARGEYGEGNQEEQIQERMELARQGVPHSFERIRPDGRVLNVCGNPLPDGGFVTTYTDITDHYKDRHALEIANRLLDDRVQQRTAELNTNRQELAEKAKTLETIMEKVTSGLALFDGGLKLSIWNDIFFEIAGYPDYLRIVGTPLIEFIRYDIDQKEYGENPEPGLADVLLEKMMEDGHPPFVSKRKNGRIISLEHRSTSVGILCTLTDITDQKKAEDFLRRNNEILEEHVQERTAALRQAKETAESASASKSAFLANMSHELRTPLNAIIGFSELLMMPDYNLIDQEKRGEYAEGINSAGIHLLQVINDILDVAKIEANQINLTTERIEMNNLISASQQLVHVEANKKHIALTASVDDNAAIILGDPTRMKQILVNLLSNAVKFTEPDGSIHVEVCRTNEGGVRLSVIDTGIGIANDDIDHVLSQFGQIESAYNRDHQGTGLGLSLVRLLTHAHDGNFQLESELDVGTKAHVYLPASRLCQMGT